MKGVDGNPEHKPGTGQKLAPAPRSNYGRNDNRRDNNRRDNRR